MEHLLHADRHFRTLNNPKILLLKLLKFIKVIIIIKLLELLKFAVVNHGIWQSDPRNLENLVQKTVVPTECMIF